jgi:hypothetical protein
MTPEEHRQRDTVGAINLDHALADTCTDADCEIHNLDVAFAEGVIGLTEMAFFVAGFFAGSAALADQHDSVKGNMQDEISQILKPQKAG